MQSLWMLVAGFFFALMGACVKLASTSFSTAEIVFYRSLLSLFIVFIILNIRKIPARTIHWRFQLWRSASGFASLLMHFYALSLLPLATAVTLSYTAPLFLAIYLFIFSKIRLKTGGIVALILGFIGVLLLFKPAFHADQIVGELIGLGSGMATGLAYFNVRELGQRGETEERTVFYFSLFSSVASGLWMIFANFSPIDLYGGAMLLGVGVCATIGQLAMTRAYKRGNTAISASLAYTTVIFASLLGIIIWQEVLPFDAWLAIIIIIVSGLLATLSARTKSASVN